MTQPATIPAELTRTVCATLAQNRQVRRGLPGWGRIHIDRKQPFLCLYRRPADGNDPGTDTLLLSQASYLLASGDPRTHASLRSLVTGLSAELAGDFGRMVLLELWSAPPGDAAENADGDSATRPIRIVAPAHAFPQSALETLERALLEADWPDRTPGIVLHYERNPAPPGLPPVLTANEADRLGCSLLGIEIPAIFRDGATGEQYPEVLRVLRRELSHILKQVFFSFSHTEGTFRPAHYHELGAHAITRVVRDVDRQLGEIGDAFDLLLHLTPTNAEAAWNAFRRSKFWQPPEFHYRPGTADPAELKRRLYRIPIERIEDPALHAFFECKRDELDRQITMMSDRGTPRVMYGSLQIYGSPGPELLQQAHRILDAVPPHTADDASSHSVDAETFAYHAQTELLRLKYAMPDLQATVQLRDDVPGVMVSRGHLLIGQDTRVAKARIEATIQHEIGTHIVTYYNGLTQPFRQLHTGSAGYEELQEGIAVLAEFLTGGLSRPRLRLLAGRVLAVDSMARGAEFVETFNTLHDRLGFSQKSAYTTTMRVYRGGGLTKDIVYLRGLSRLLNALAQGARLPDLLIGKIAFEDLDVISELRWRKVLKPGPLRPAYLDQPAGKQRLRRITTEKCTDLLDLVTGDDQ